MAGYASNQYYKGDTPVIRYHYASLQGLVGIIGEKRIRQTDVRFLNDASEVSYALDLYDLWLESNDGETRAYWEERLEQRRIFITSFSQRNDSPAMWQTYGSAGPAVAIGIDLNLWNRYEKFGRRQIFDVLYADSFEEAISAFDNSSLSWTKNQAHAESVNEDRWELGALAGIKHPSFAGEAETRLVTVGLDRAGELDHRSSGGLIVPYIHTDFTGDGVSRSYLEENHPEQLLPVYEIVVGPLGNFAMISDGIRSLMEAAGLRECPITQSTVPLRF